MGNMKLYFYELDTGSYGREPEGISCIECEAEEKPKTYVPLSGKSFPEYMARLKKDDIGRFISLTLNVVAFTEPSFEHAKEMFKAREIARIKNTKERLSEMENILKVIEESEEIIDE